MTGVPHDGDLAVRENLPLTRTARRAGSEIGIAGHQQRRHLQRGDAFPGEILLRSLTGGRLSAARRAVPSIGQAAGVGDADGDRAPDLGRQLTERQGS